MLEVDGFYFEENDAARVFELTHHQGWQVLLGVMHNEYDASQALNDENLLTDQNAVARENYRKGQMNILKRLAGVCEKAGQELRNDIRISDQE